MVLGGTFEPKFDGQLLRLNAESLVDLIEARIFSDVDHQGIAAIDCAIKPEKGFVAEGTYGGKDKHTEKIRTELGNDLMELKLSPKLTDKLVRNLRHPTRSDRLCSFLVED